MTTAIINHIRGYFEDCTVGEVYLPNTYEKYCYTLEDVARPPNVKIPAQTCIPEGVYKVTRTMSNKYQKMMVQLYNVEQDLSVERDGKRFVGIRVHGGNDVDDSEGCPLVAYNFDGDDSIWGSASKDLDNAIGRLLDRYNEVLWVISS